MELTFNLQHWFEPSSPMLENILALRCSMDYIINLNHAFLLYNRAPNLYQSGVRYGRTRIWEPIPALYSRRAGDCKSLSAALIAQYRMSGITAQPVFRWVKNSDGTVDYHILVQTYSGFEDPSKVLGMGKNENERFYVDGTMSWSAEQGSYRLKS